MEEAVTGNTMLLRTIRAAYYATISYVDKQIGRILEAIGSDMDNTLVLFTTDHGEMLGDYGCVGKRCMLEASVRVPLIARLPGFLPENHICNAPASSIDLMPTICEATGIQMPELSEAKSLRGVSGMEAGERIVFSQFSRKWNGQYYATDGLRSYGYSAADKREWNYALQDELDQGPILDLDGHGAMLRDALIERHRHDWYSQAVDGDTWYDHDVPVNPLESDPNYGYLFAEPSERIQAAIDALGPDYARKSTKIGRGHPMREHMIPLTNDEIEKWIDSKLHVGQLYE